MQRFFNEMTEHSPDGAGGVREHYREFDSWLGRSSSAASSPEKSRQGRPSGFVICHENKAGVRSDIRTKSGCQV